MTRHARPIDSVAWIVWLMAVAWISISVQSVSADELSQGQKVYVPIYSHIYSGDKENPFLLTAILSVRNIDPGHAITLTAVDYFDSDGKPLRRYLEKPVELGAFGVDTIRRRRIGQKRRFGSQICCRMAGGFQSQPTHLGRGHDRHKNAAGDFFCFPRPGDSRNQGQSLRRCRPAFPGKGERLVVQEK